MNNIEQYNLVWNSQSNNSSESMPLSGHDIGCNVWVERNNILAYFQQSGGFDENNSMLKQGRIKIWFERNPFKESFSQTLSLQDGSIIIKGDDCTVTMWIDVFNPVIHIDIKFDTPNKANIRYENWRFKDRPIVGWREFFQCKEVWGYPDGEIIHHKDDFEVLDDGMYFYHRNKNDDLSFDKEMDTQGLADFKHMFYNPQINRTTGGLLKAYGTKFTGEFSETYLHTPFNSWTFEATQSSKSQKIDIFLYTAQELTLDDWKTKIDRIIEKSSAPDCRENTKKWWNDFWSKSYIQIDDSKKDEKMWEIARNYQLFRYMEASNYMGFWPNKFNGGLFTYDPCLVETEQNCTPDYRKWSGGTFTIQNQRLLFWPKLKSGDFDVMPQFFDFFNRLLLTEKVRAKELLHVSGAVYPEQISSYGLCCTRDHGWGNTTGLPVPQIKYLFSNTLEVALMIIEYHKYTGRDISEYIEFMEELIVFYDTFYPENDEHGKMVMYPANALESYHPVKNPVDAIAGLKSLINEMLELSSDIVSDERKAKLKRILDRVPELSYTEKDGHKIIAYAETTSPIHNIEIPQLYTVFPYGLYGIDRPDMDIAVNTALYAPECEEQLWHVSWHNVGVQYAHLQMVDEAFSYLKKKLCSANRRMPTFWGPGHDWTPDHNHGGSGSIQLQDMLLQAYKDKIYILPCWDKSIDVSFKLFAPQNTTVELELKNGKIEKLDIFPKEREKDIVIF